ncbi:RluA family pseudouridine synthase [Bacillota bacterium]
MMKTLLRIEESDAGERIDAALADILTGVSRSSIQRLIEKDKVLVNGLPVISKSYKLKEGDSVDISFEEPVLLAAIPENLPLDIFYEDDDVIVVNKPKGMVVHPAPGNPQGTLVNGILYHCQGRLSSINGIIRPGIVHRIDKDTSGLLVVAKNDAAHRNLAEQFAAHSITREYRAIVYNNFSEDEGTVDAPIGRDPKNRLRMAVTEKNSKPARTRYKVLERFGRFTYIEAVLETGRTHQIRVHMAYINHPLLGDEVYGPNKKDSKIRGQMLHAGTIGFKHPASGQYVEFHSPLPDDFRRVLEKLR